MIYRTIMIIMKRGIIHLQITNLGWPKILCKSQDGYITSLDIQKNYFPNFTLKPSACLKNIFKNSY
jgi:hypothetical protein